MARDIGSIIEQVRNRLPNVTAMPVHMTHPADDDGIWWILLPNVERDIQIESSLGNCPFMIEHDDMHSTAGAIAAHNVDDVVNNVVGYLHSIK
jgi:hypothetical protein